MEFRILGPVEVIDAGKPLDIGAPLDRALLARLLVDAGRIVSLDRLIGDLWAGEAPDSALGSVRVRVSRVRKALGNAGEGVIRTQQPGYVLVLGDNDSLDDALFQQLANGGRAALEGGDPEAAVGLLTEALAMWRGPALADVGDAPFAQTEAARLEETRLAALEARIDADLTLGRHTALVAELDVLCAQYPLRERFWAQRMLALYRSGRQSDALAAFQELRRILSEQLGLDPSPELTLLESQILAQAPELADSRASLKAESRARDELPTGVVTFLFTDIERSSELWESDPKTMSSILQQHERIIAEAVDSHRGSLIKSKGEGDSTLSVFRRATDAIGAALQIAETMGTHQWPSNVSLGVRVGLHTGEAYERDGDYYGPTLNRAARLRSFASGGQIVLSRVTADLVRDHLPDHADLIDLGEHTLRGLARTEQIFELASPAISARPSAESTRPRLPDPLTLVIAGPFVDRNAEIERLNTLWKEASAGSTQAVFIAGEPGIGKTRLVAEVARTLFEDDAVVLYGRNDEDGLLPYQPFVEALRHYVAHQPPQVRRVLPRAADLAHLLPELGSERSVVSSQDDPEVARYRLLEAVVAVLAHAGAQAPILLVLDDLHWADRPTLVLLRHLLRVGGSNPMLIVGTYRESELAHTRPFAELLADLRRERTLQRIRIRGLDEDATVAFFERTVEHDIGRRGRRLARTVAEITEGNPFFMEQIVGHLIETGSIVQREGRYVLEERIEDLGIPEEVTEAIGRRLSRLSEACNRALRAASVLGKDFEIGILTAVMDSHPDEVLAAVEEGIAAGLVRESPDQARAECTFSHALVQQTLYEDVSVARRQRLHLKAAEAIEGATGIDPTVQITSIARHLRSAGAAADPEKAIDYLIRAEDAAWRVFAFEEALEHATAALELMSTGDADLRRRAQLLERLGDLMFVTVPDMEPRHSIQYLSEAAALLDKLDDDQRRAAVLVKIARAKASGGLYASLALDDLRLAAELLGPGPDPLTEARLNVIRSLLYVFALRPDDALALADRAMESAEKLGSDVWRGSAYLNRGFALHLLGPRKEASGLMEDVWNIGDRLDHVNLAFTAAWGLGGCSVRSDPLAAYEFFRREFDKPRQAQASGPRHVLGDASHTCLALSGDLRKAWELQDEELRPGTPRYSSWAVPDFFREFTEGDWESAISRTEQSVAVLRERGNLFGVACSLLYLAKYQSHLGPSSDARESLRAVVELTAGNHVEYELLARSHLAVLDIELGASADAKSHITRGREIETADEGWGGIVDTLLVAEAVLAASDGRLAEAERSFSDAIDLTARFHLPFQRAEAFFHWGRVLATPDPSRAVQKFDAAIDIYREIEASERFVERVKAERHLSA